MACHKKTVLKYVSLVVGCICTMAGGSIGAINSYSSDLRDTFNLTQSQGKTAQKVISPERKCHYRHENCKKYFGVRNTNEIPLDGI